MYSFMQGIPPELMAVASDAWRPSGTSKVAKKAVASDPPNVSPCKKRKQPEAEVKSEPLTKSIWDEKGESDRKHETKAEKRSATAAVAVSAEWGGAKTAAAGLRKRNGSSGSSDHATDTEFHMASSSPDQPGDLPSCTGRGVSVSGPGQLRRDDAACQAGNGIVLPPSCVFSSLLSSAANSMRSISPFDFHTPVPSSSTAGGGRATIAASTSSGLSLRPEDDPLVTEMVGRARGIKKAADAGRGPKGELTVPLLCKYIESALVYMEACECILGGGGGGATGVTPAAPRLNSRSSTW